MKNSGTCEQLTVDAPGDCGGWDAFSLTVQSHSFPRSIQLVLGLLCPVWGRYKQEANSYSLLLSLRTNAKGKSPTIVSELKCDTTND